MHENALKFLQYTHSEQQNIINKLKATGENTVYLEQIAILTNPKFVKAIGGEQPRYIPRKSKLTPQQYEAIVTQTVILLQNNPRIKYPYTVMKNITLPEGVYLGDVEAAIAEARERLKIK